MSPSPEQVLTLAQDLRQELADLGGRLRLTLGDAPVNPVRVPTALMDPVPGIDNMWWLQLPCAYPQAPTCTRLIVGGLMGAHAERVTVPHTVRLHLLEGSLLWWQTSQGLDEEGQPAYHRYTKGDTWSLEPGEEHGYVALADFLFYNVFSPVFQD